MVWVMVIRSGSVIVAGDMEPCDFVMVGKYPSTRSTPSNSQNNLRAPGEEIKSSYISLGSLDRKSGKFPDKIKETGRTSNGYVSTTDC